MRNTAWNGFPVKFLPLRILVWCLEELEGDFFLAKGFQLGLEFKTNFNQRRKVGSQVQQAYIDLACKAAAMITHESRQ